MFEAIIYALITICVFVLVAYLIIWVLGQIGVPLPDQVIKVIWVIVALVCILVLWQLLGGMLRIPTFK